MLVTASITTVHLKPNDKSEGWLQMQFGKRAHKENMKTYLIFKTLALL